MDIKQAQLILTTNGAKITPTGAICDIGGIGYSCGGPSPKTIQLDGDFDADTLEALVLWMRDPSAFDIRPWQRESLANN